MPVLRLPKPFVVGGGANVDVCARHGRPASVRYTVMFESRPPRWTLILVVCGFLPYLLVRTLTRRYLTVREWPFCPRCIGLRRMRLAVAIVLFSMVPVGVVAAAAFGLATITPGNQAVGKALLITAAVALLAALIVMSYASYPSAGGAQVSRDGHWLLVRRQELQIGVQHRHAELHNKITGRRPRPVHTQLTPGHTGTSLPDLPTSTR
jgi:hypothetical protein